MLKVLVKKQLAEVYHRSFRGGRRGKKRSASGMAILLAVLTVYLVACFSYMAWALSDPMFGAEMGWLYYLLMSVSAILFGTLGSVFSTYATLYLAKDNDLLLSMPIPVRDVILSRLMGVYVTGLLYSGVISLPTVVVGLIRGGFTLTRLAGGIVLILLISLIVLGLSALLGWVVARLSLRLKNKSYLTVLISLLFLGLYFFFYYRIMNGIQDLIRNMLDIGAKIKASLYPIYLFGRIAEGDLLAALLWTLGVLAALALIWLGMKRTFLSIATASAGGAKAVYREKAGRQAGVSAALLRREWFRFSSSANYMLNCGLGALFLLGLGIYLLFAGKGLLGYLSLLPFGLAEAIPVLLTAVCCMIAGIIYITAPSVSLEGKTLWQIQSLPVTAWQVLRAKLELHLAVAAVPVLFCALVLAVLAPATLAQKLLMLALTVLAVLFNAMFGLLLGLKLPNLNWTNEVVPIKQSAAVLIAMFSGMGLGLAIGGLYLWFGAEIGPTAWLSAFSLLLLAADAALFLWLRRSGAKRFSEL